MGLLVEYQVAQNIRRTIQIIRYLAIATANNARHLFAMDGRMHGYKTKWNTIEYEVVYLTVVLIKKKEIPDQGC